jgi:hypothetical protein
MKRCSQDESELMYARTKISAGWLLCAAFALASLTPGSAVAQQRDPAAAQALFDQARELSRQGRYAEACPKLLESNRLDPGIGTQFHLAECYEQTGQVATAWATFLEVASIARASNQLDREKAATKRAAQLEPRLPKLTVSVPEANQVQGLEIRRDGIVIGAVQWGTPVPVDPGEHELTVTAPGRQPLAKKLTLEQGKALSFEVPALDSDSGASTEPPPAEPAEQAEPAQPAPPAFHPHHRKKQPEQPSAEKSNVDAWPFVLGGAGIVGLGLGTAFALKALSTDSQSKDDCDATNMNVCGPTGLRLRNDALAQGNIATIGFTSGAVLLLVAGVVWDMEARSPSHSAEYRVNLHASAAITPGNAALYLQGGF